MSKKESSWRGVVDLPEANQLLKNKPEAGPNLNSYDNMFVQESYYKNKDDLCYVLRNFLDMANKAHRFC